MKLINTNRFYLPVVGDPKGWLHLASIQDGLREYMCFINTHTQEVFVESITGGHLEQIEDDSLAEALYQFLDQNGILDRSKPLLPDKEWLYKGKV